MKIINGVVFSNSLFGFDKIVTFKVRKNDRTGG